MSDVPSETELEPRETSGKKKPKKINKSEIFNNLVEVIDGFVNPKWPTFPRRFLIARDKSGSPLWLERDSFDMIWLSSQEALCETLKKYAAQIPRLGIALESYNYRAISDLWAWHTRAIQIEDIAVVQQKSERGLTWHRMAFDFAEGPCELWDEILGRMENAQAFLCWFGSLFDSRSDRAQAIWLAGSGDNSKGTIIDMLAHIFGVNRGFKTAEPWNIRPPQFWKRTIIGARVVCFTECNDPKFTQSEGFKSLTGDSLHTIDGKFADIFTAELNCKFLIASNSRAEITGEWSERKRLIPCWLEPIAGEKFLAKGILYPRLIAELPAFCHKAYEMYKHLCPDSGRIGTSDSVIEAIVENAEENFQAMFDLYFVADKSAAVDRRDMHKFRNLPDIRMLNDNQFSKFVKFLNRKGIHRRRNAERTMTYYYGMQKSALFERLTISLESQGLSVVAGGINGLNGNGHHVDESESEKKIKPVNKEDVARLMAQEGN